MFSGVLLSYWEVGVDHLRISTLKNGHLKKAQVPNKIISYRIPRAAQ